MTALPTLFLMVTMATAPRAAASDSAALVQLLGTFLDGAGKPGAAVHERFWADDLIYTGSSGRRIGKADILRDIGSSPPPSASDPVTTYGAEDVRVQQYGNTAIVAFRLVANTDDHGRREVASYLNTGTFVKRNGEWRAAGWQATRMPFSDEAARRTVGEATARFWRALTAADTAALATLLDDGFLWTAADGERWGRGPLFQALTSGTFHVERVADDATPLVRRGETAVVGGTSWTSRATGGNPRPAPTPSHYSLTLVREGGGWVALALQSAKTP